MKLKIAVSLLVLPFIASASIEKTNAWNADIGEELKLTNDTFTTEGKPYNSKEIAMGAAVVFDPVQATYTNPLNVMVADPFVYEEDGIYYLY